MSWVLSLLAPFLVGAATGGWWSRRRAIHAAVSSAVAAAHASAVASGGSVYIAQHAADFADWSGAGSDVDLPAERAAFLNYGTDHLGLGPGYDLGEFPSGSRRVGSRVTQRDLHRLQAHNARRAADHSTDWDATS